MNRINKSNAQSNKRGHVTSGFQIINETDSIMHGTGDYGHLKRTSEDAGLDNCTDSENDTLSPAHPGVGVFTNPVDGNPKPGKKTRGRVKIDMKYIENKLRRYTTFSKRKTGIMKKAYELSTLTGTQVMLLVASETGHVYTFATRKLQPMITSETGKALIQTCLNSPDLGQSSPGQGLPSDQRMNPTGFEETEITYSQDDDTSARDISSGIPVLNHLNTINTANIKQEPFVPKTVSQAAGFVIHPSIETNGSVALPQTQEHISPKEIAVSQVAQTYAAQVQVTDANGPGAINIPTSSGMTVQMPPPGFMIQTGGTNLPPISLSPFETPSSQTQHITAVAQNHPAIQQFQYRHTTENNAPLVQVSAAGTPIQSIQQANDGVATMVSSTQPQLVTQAQHQANVAALTALQNQQRITLMPGGINQVGSSSQPALVYQTPGMVYATPQQVQQTLGSLPESIVLGLQQAQALGIQQASALNMPQQGDNQQGGAITSAPQYITIPVPVSLANAAQTQMFSIPVAQNAQHITQIKKS